MPDGAGHRGRRRTSTPASSTRAIPSSSPQQVLDAYPEPHADRHHPARDRTAPRTTAGRPAVNDREDFLLSRALRHHSHRRSRRRRRQLRRRPDLRPCSHLAEPAGSPRIRRRRELPEALHPRRLQPRQPRRSRTLCCAKEAPAASSAKPFVAHASAWAMSARMSTERRNHLPPVGELS